MAVIETTGFWTGYWWWWLLAVAVSWLAMEILSIVVAHLRGQRDVMDWTLSDTIRRWSAAHRWLAPLVVGVCAMLLFHWFGMTNR